jgi:anti-anti-sigma factor
MNIEHKFKDGVYVITVSGDIQQYSNSPLYGNIPTHKFFTHLLNDAHLKLSSDDVLVNLSGVEYIDSYAVGAFIGLYKRLKERGGSLSFCCVNEPVFQIFQILNINKIIPFYETEEIAFSKIMALS